MLRPILLLFIFSSFIGCAEAQKVIGQDNSEDDRNYPEITRENSKNLLGFGSEPKIIYGESRLGSGYNSAIEHEYYGVMEYKGLESSTEIISGATGNRGGITLDVITNESDFMKSLEINVKGSLDLSFKGFSAKNSYKSRYFKKKTINKFNQYGVIKASYINEPRVLINNEIRDKFIQLAERDQESFLRTCGDMYVNKVYTGGNLYIVVRSETQEENERIEFKKDLELARGFLKNNLSLSYTEESITDFNKRMAKSRIEIFTEGGGAIDIDFDKEDGTFDIQKLVEYAGKFKEQVQADKGAVVLYSELAPYESLPGFPNVDFAKIRNNQKNFIELLISKIDSLKLNYSNASFVSRNGKYFDIKHVESADMLVSNLVMKKDTLSLLKDKCVRDCNKCDIDELKKIKVNNYKVPSPLQPIYDGEELELPQETSAEFMLLSKAANLDRKIQIVGELYVSNRLAQPEEPYCLEPIVKEHTYYNSQNTCERTVVKYHSPRYLIRLQLNGKAIRDYYWRGQPKMVPKGVDVYVRLENPGSRTQVVRSCISSNSSHTNPVFVLGNDQCLNALGRKGPYALISSAYSRKLNPKLKADKTTKEISELTKLGNFDKEGTLKIRYPFNYEDYEN